MEVAAALHLKPKESEYAKLLFFSMAWGAMVGGNFSFLGSSRAALSLGMLQKSYGLGISFAQWMVAAAPVVILGLLTTPLVLRLVIRPEPVDFGAARRVIERAVENLGPMRRPQYTALAIISLTIAAWVSVGGRRVDLAVIALLGAVTLFVFKVLTWEKAERHIYWNIVLMYGGAIALGSALDKTGAARWLLQGVLDGYQPSAQMTIIGAAVLALLMSEVMSNAAALAVVLPLAFTLAAQSGASPVALVLAVSFGAGLDFVFPMSTAPNTIIFASGYLKPVGLPQGRTAHDGDVDPHPDRGRDVVVAAHRALMTTHKGAVVWFTGLPSSGKSTIAQAVYRRLFERRYAVELLDGSEVRESLSRGLGFSREDREENVRRIGYVAKLLARNGVIAICAAVSPFRATRDEVRRHTRDFLEVYVDCPVEVAESRDTDGMYAKARRGEIEEFTGVNAPYEPPESPEVHIHADRESPEDAAWKVLRTLEMIGVIPDAPEEARTSQEDDIRRRLASLGYL